MLARKNQTEEHQNITSKETFPRKDMREFRMKSVEEEKEHPVSLQLYALRDRPDVRMREVSQ
jgi:hypothetical protein